MALRQAQIAPMVADLENWTRTACGKLSRHNDVAKAMDYMLKRWAAFSRFQAFGVCRLGLSRELRDVGSQLGADSSPPASEH